MTISPETPTPEKIAAYADGELDGEALREVEAALAADPELQAQVEAHRALKAKLSAHFAPVMDMPVPEPLIRAVTGGAQVVDFAEAAARRRAAAAPPPRFRWVGPALAATLVIGLVSFGMSKRDAHDYATGDVAIALDRQLVATQPKDAPVRVLLSFRDGEGNFCRGFSSQMQSGVACRDGRGWKFGAIYAGGKAGGGEYQQAGSADVAVMEAIQNMAKGPALDADGERSAMRANWRK